MASLTDLVTSGVLYEGNFRTWKVRMDAILRVHRLEIYANDDRLSNSDEEWINNSHAAAVITRSFVRPDLFARVPNDDRLDAKRLMNRLETLALRFRFLDLPAELRVRIYGYIMPESKRWTIEPLMRKVPHYPAITTASRRLRFESLPIFYSKTNIVLSFSPSGSVSQRGHAARSLNERSSVRYWAGKISGTLLKHLRKVTLSFRVESATVRRGRTLELIFIYSSQEGFTIPDRSPLSPDARTLLDNHVAEVEANRKTLRLQGEAIILALISNPHLWEYGILQSKR